MPQKKRAKKTSSGLRKSMSFPEPLSYLQKTLLGGGGMAVAEAMSRRIQREHPPRKSNKEG